MPFFGGGGGGGDYVILTNNNIDGGNNVMALVTGVNNVGLDNAALQDLTTGSYNVAVGAGALQSLTEGSRNIAVGSGALGLLTTDNDNIVLGDESFNALVGGLYNIAIGSTLNQNTSGVSDTITISGNATVNGVENGIVFIGSCAFPTDFAGFPNSVYIGTTLGTSQGLGSRVVSIGHQSSPRDNDVICIGYGSIARDSAAVAIGRLADATGDNSIAIGNAVAVTDGIAIGNNTQTNARIGAHQFGVSTWATLPAANSVQTGCIFRVTDIGVNGSHWFSDGAIWRPVSGKLLLTRLAAAVTSIANAAEQVLYSLLLPAGLISPRRSITVKFVGHDSGNTDSMSLRIRAGVNNSAADALLYYGNGLAAARAYASKFSFFRVTNTDLANFGWTSSATSTFVPETGSGNTLQLPSAASPAVVGNMDNVANYLTFSAQSLAGTDTFTLDHLQVFLTDG